MLKPQKYFVTGIGTDVGKTVVSAILVEALKADYWKPIQAGLTETDSQKVQLLAKNCGTIWPEVYSLKAPLSPHESSAKEGVEIDLKRIDLSICYNNIVIEGAGGILVPLNSRQTILDLIEKLDIPVVLVSRHYLGSINHTLLSIEMLKARNIPIHLLVFIGNNLATESIILKMSGIKNYIKIDEVDKIGSNFVELQSKRFLPFFV